MNSSAARLTLSTAHDLFDHCRYASARIIDPAYGFEKEIAVRLIYGFGFGIVRSFYQLDSDLESAGLFHGRNLYGAGICAAGVLVELEQLKAFYVVKTVFAG